MWLFSAQSPALNKSSFLPQRNLLKDPHERAKRKWLWPLWSNHYQTRRPMTTYRTHVFPVTVPDDARDRYYQNSSLYCIVLITKHLQCLSVLRGTLRGETTQVRYLLLPLVLRGSQIYIKQMAAKLGQRRCQRMIKNRKNPTLVTALVHSFPYTTRLQRKKMRRWSKAGKRMLRTSSFL